MTKSKIIGGAEKLDAGNTKRLIGGCRVVVGWLFMVVVGGVEGGCKEECNIVTRVELHDLSGGDGSIVSFSSAILGL
ncbi:hypothetical protein HanIR_Chr09g0442321 [Helianthus annuus]|nr:hypothetical protein HanIR_Chr09g0442321 [Helianthus annuus]